jgi:hypothetical protein
VRVDGRGPGGNPGFLFLNDFSVLLRVLFIYSHSAKNIFSDLTSLNLQVLDHFSSNKNSSPKVCMAFIFDIMCITELSKLLATI